MVQYYRNWRYRQNLILQWKNVFTFLHAIIGHLDMIFSFKFCTIIACYAINKQQSHFVYLDGVSLSRSQVYLIKHRNNSSTYQTVFKPLIWMSVRFSYFFYKIRCFDGTPVDIIFIAEHLIFCFSFTQNMLYFFCLFTNFSVLRKIA